MYNCDKNIHEMMRNSTSRLCSIIILATIMNNFICADTKPEIKKIEQLKTKQVRITFKPPSFPSVTEYMYEVKSKEGCLIKEGQPTIDRSGQAEPTFDINDLEPSNYDITVVATAFGDKITKSFTTVSGK